MERNHKNVSNTYKELTPVIYGKNGIKFQHFSRSSLDHKLCFPAHWHDRIELLHILDGSMEIHLNEETLTVPPGHLIVIMPHVVHYGFAGENGVAYDMITFDIGKFYNGTVASDKYLKPVCDRNTSFNPTTKNPAILNKLNELSDALSNEEPPHALCIVGKVYEIIGLLYRHCVVDSEQPYKHDERFIKVLDYINSHYTENISASTVSQKFGYDETYFCRRFKNITGITTMKYIQILRMEKAQELLQTTTDDIRHIAWKCGFSSISYFSNCFKRHTGMTPTDFRSLNDI